MNRPHVFIKELELYLAHFSELWEDLLTLESPNIKEEKRLQKFKENMEKGIHYYEELISIIPFENTREKIKFRDALKSAKESLEASYEVPAQTMVI